MIRASSRSARAGTLASTGFATACSSVVCLTLSRYESVATIVSVSPSACTRTPVRIGRTSSRDAARATRSIVAASGAPGKRTVSPSTSGSRGKSSAGRVRR